jgi:hypothetical protein
MAKSIALSLQSLFLMAVVAIWWRREGRFPALIVRYIEQVYLQPNYLPRLQFLDVRDDNELHAHLGR